MMAFLLVIEAFQPSRFTRTPRQCFSQAREDDSAAFAETLPLSEDDKARLLRLRSRQLTLPIVFLDAMVPLQQLTFRSSDPKLKTLIQTCFQQDIDEVGMFGLNPRTRQPLCDGVSFLVNNSTVQYQDDGTLTLQVMAQKRRLEIQGEPWLDDTNSFYMALVEVQRDDDSSVKVLTPKQQAQAQQLSDTLPALVDEWKQAVLTAKATDPEGLQLRCEPLGPMPESSSLTDRAFWVAALINPLPPLGVCLEIRPTMLAAENDYDRILLACQAIQGSIDHLTGKQKLF